MPAINPPLSGPLVSAVGGALRSDLLTISKRAPDGIVDHAGKGYSTSSLWQYKGQIWQPTYADTQCATWAQLTQRGAPPVDILGSANVAAACGLMRLVSGYTGAAVDISATINGSTVTATINILSSGQLDEPAAWAIVGRADTGTFVYITKAYDQTGNGNHAVQYGTSNYPLLLWDEVMGRFVMSHTNPADSATRRCLQMTSVALTQNNCAMFIMGRHPGSSSDLYAGVFGQLGLSTNYTWCATDTLGGYMANASTGGEGIASPYIAGDTGPGIYSYVASSAGEVMGYNERLGTTTKARGANALAGALLGSLSLGTDYYSVMFAVGYVICSSAPSTTTQQTLRQSAYTLLNACPQALATVVFSGDSRFAGVQEQLMANPANALTKLLAVPATVINIGKSSATTALLNTVAARFAPVLGNSASKRIVVLCAGVNDFVVSGLTAAQSWAGLQTIVATWRASGWTVVTIAEANYNSSGGEPFLTALRALILAAGAGPSSPAGDYVIDISQLYPVANPANTLFYADGLHWTAPTSHLIASAVANVLNPLLAA